MKMVNKSPRNNVRTFVQKNILKKIDRNIVKPIDKTKVDKLINKKGLIPGVDSRPLKIGGKEWTKVQ